MKKTVTTSAPDKKNTVTTSAPDKKYRYNIST
jgi:hypothetical protein